MCTHIQCRSSLWRWWRWWIGCRIANRKMKRKYVLKIKWQKKSSISISSGKSCMQIVERPYTKWFLVRRNERNGRKANQNHRWIDAEESTEEWMKHGSFSTFEYSRSATFIICSGQIEIGQLKWTERNEYAKTGNSVKMWYLSLENDERRCRSDLLHNNTRHYYGNEMQNYFESYLLYPKIIRCDTVIKLTAENEIYSRSAARASVATSAKQNFRVRLNAIRDFHISCEPFSPGNKYNTFSLIPSNWELYLTMTHNYFISHFQWALAVQPIFPLKVEIMTAERKPSESVRARVRFAQCVSKSIHIRSIGRSFATLHTHINEQWLWTQRSTSHTHSDTHTYVKCASIDCNNWIVCDYYCCSAAKR